jgi:thiamine monophosphate synthase
MGFPIRFTAYLNGNAVTGIKQWQVNKYQDPQIAGVAMQAARAIIPNVDLSQLPDKDWDKIKAKKTAEEAIKASNPQEAINIIKQRAKEAMAAKQN